MVKRLKKRNEINACRLFLVKLNLFLLNPDFAIRKGFVNMRINIWIMVKSFFWQAKKLKVEHLSDNGIRKATEKEKRRPFLDLAGAWKNDKDIDIIFKKALCERKEIKFRV